MPLPPLHPDFTCLVTGCTNGIGHKIARQLAEAGTCVVMAVQNTTRANVLTEKWQFDWSKRNLPLNIEVKLIQNLTFNVMELNLLSLDSVARFAEAWNALSVLLHVLINNAGIFSSGESQKKGPPSRIVYVSSTILGFVGPEDMNVSTGKKKYTNLVGYSGSKLLQVMFSSIPNNKLPSETGISIVYASPEVVQTNFVYWFWRNQSVHFGLTSVAYHYKKRSALLVFKNRDPCKWTDIFLSWQNRDTYNWAEVPQVVCSKITIIQTC
ncbi:hypothetical protein ACET3Z_018598 [Daucus carota]